METTGKAYTYTGSAYGTQYSASASRGTDPQDLEQHANNADYYHLFLLLQDLLRGQDDFILEFPADEWGSDAVSTGLGGGGFASVSRKIANRRWGHRNAMAYKRVRPSFDSDGRVDERAALAQVMDELKVLSSASIRSHANINRLRGVVFETQSHRTDGRLFPALILDPSPLGSLLAFIQDPVRMVDGPYWQFCMDVGRGLQALHKNRFIHGDVKCENVLVFPAVDYQGRDLVARLTDFGCSMAFDSVDPNAYTRLRGATPPYDAPEAGGVIQRDNLPSTDIYSFGLLVWRVALDGAEPFNLPRYRESAPDDDGTRYNYALIREDKGNENILSTALHDLLDPALGHSPSTAESHCRVLSIALSSDPTQRNLDHIMEVFECSQGDFQRRTFGLTALSALHVRLFAKFDIMCMGIISRARYGLSAWSSIPPKAHQLYHVVHRYGTIGSDFRGFGLSRLPAASECLRNLLLAIEDVYVSSGTVFSIETIPPVLSSNFLSMKNACDESSRITASAIKRAIDVAMLRLERPSATAAMEEIINGMEKFRDACTSASSLFKPPAVRQPEGLSGDIQRSSEDGREDLWHAQGMYDRTGGLVTTDTNAMVNEGTKPESSFPAYSASSYLDFHLLSTCRLPFAIQEQLFTYISFHARSLANRPSGRVVAMEEGICYGLGFGVEQDYTRYLSIIKQCSAMGHQPAQESLQNLHDALGLPLSQDIESSPQISNTPSIQPLAHGDDSIHNVAICGPVADIESQLKSNPSQVNARNEDGDTPLIAASRAGNLPVANFLVCKGADCSASNNLGESSIHWVWAFDAASMPGLVSRMIHGRADPNAVANERPLLDPYTPYPLVRGTALHRAVAQANKAAVQELVRNGASVFQAGGPVSFHRGRCSSLDAVQLACTWHDAEILQLLLDAAPFYAVNAEASSSGVSLLYFALQCQTTHHRMARHGSGQYTRLQETIDLLISRGCTNIVDKDGQTALQLAVASDSPEILEYVLAVDVFVKDINTVVDEKTALHVAISRGRPAAFELLIRNGANVFPHLTADAGLDFPILFAQENEYFVRRILTLGEESISDTHKHQALKTSLVHSQWKLANFLLENGAHINGLTHGAESLRHNVLGSVISSSEAGKVIETLETTLALAAKHNQKPQFIMCPAFHESALHVAAGRLFLHSKHETVRLFSLLLGMFPGQAHLEARNIKGWTPLQMAITHRNVVAVRALLDAGADVNAMASIERSPVGPSPKDMVFAQPFSREEYYDIDPTTRKEGERALEQLFRLFNNDPSVSPVAKRSVTLRFQQRQNMPPRDRKVADFVETLSLLPRPLPPPRESVALVDRFFSALRVGQQAEFLRDSKINPLDIARSIQWIGLERVRFLRQEGGEVLRHLGLWDAYLDG